MNDLLQRFSFDDLPIRGAITRLSQTWQAVRSRNNVALPAQGLLGEALAASALLSSGVKIRARIGLQLQGEGPLKLLLAQCGSDGNQRGIAHCRETVDPGVGFTDLTAASTLVISIDGEDQDHRYQGIVPLEGDSLATTLEGYFQRSEQLATRIWLVADHEHAAGLLIQRLPHHNDHPTSWDEIVNLAKRLSLEELLGLSPKTLLSRLFAGQTLMDGGVTPLEFGCQCSREKVVQVLRVLGPDTLKPDADAGPEVTVDCEFCNERYRFDAIDIEQMLNHPSRQTQ